MDFKFTDLPGRLAAFHHHPHRIQRGDFHRRPRLRRLEHPRLEGDQRLRHARHSRSGDARGSISSTPSRRSASSARSSIRSRASPTIAIRAGSRKKRRRICKAPALPTPRSSGRKRNFSSSTTCVSATPGTVPPTRSTAPRGIGTAGAKNFQTSVTRSGRRKAISRSRRRTRCRTSATKCASSSRKPASRSSASITKSRPPVRPRSISASRRSRRWATTCSTTNTSSATWRGSTTRP